MGSRKLGVLSKTSSQSAIAEEFLLDDGFPFSSDATGLSAPVNFQEEEKGFSPNAKNHSAVRDEALSINTEDTLSVPMKI